jgi:hypothetical protein
MAQRAGAKITEIDGSHLIMVSQPDAVTGASPQTSTSLLRVDRLDCLITVIGSARSGFLSHRVRNVGRAELVKPDSRRKASAADYVVVGVAIGRKNPSDLDA